MMYNNGCPACIAFQYDNMSIMGNAAVVENWHNNKHKVPETKMTKIKEGWLTVMCRNDNHNLCGDSNHDICDCLCHRAVRLALLKEKVRENQKMIFICGAFMFIAGVCLNMTDDLRIIYWLTAWIILSTAVWILNIYLAITKSRRVKRMEKDPQPMPGVIQVGAMSVNEIREIKKKYSEPTWSKDEIEKRMR